MPLKSPIGTTVQEVKNGLQLRALLAESGHNTTRADRIRVLLAVIDKLVRKSRTLADEQKKIRQQIDGLRQELAAIRQASAAKKRDRKVRSHATNHQSL